MDQRIKELEKYIIESNTGDMYPVQDSVIEWYGCINGELRLFSDLVSLYNCSPEFIVFERSYKQYNGKLAANIKTLFFDKQIQPLDYLTFNFWKIITRVSKNNYWKYFIIEDKHGERRVHEFTTYWIVFLSYVNTFTSQYSDWNDYDEKTRVTTDNIRQQL